MATRVVKKLSPAELERNQAVLLNTGLAIGQHKGAYQMSSKDGRFVFRNYYPTTFNLFGVKQEDGKQFVLDVLRGIQICSISFIFPTLMFLREQAVGSGV